MGSRGAAHEDERGCASQPQPRSCDAASLSCLGHELLFWHLPLETFFAVAVCRERYVRRLSGFVATQIIEGCEQSAEGPAALNTCRSHVGRAW